MSETMHIVWKDMRRLRWVLALWVAVLIARVALLLNGAAAAADFGVGLFLREVSGAVGMVELLLTALIIARLVHEEPLVGFTAFWLTRPYDVGKLVRAKLLSAVVVLVLLPLLADLTLMSVFGAGPPALVRAGATAAITYMSWTLSLMVIATLTPSLGVFVLTILGIVAGTSVLLVSMLGLATLWVEEPSAYTPPSVPDATGGIVMMAVYLSAALSVIVFQYRHRRWGMATALTIVGLAATIVIPMYWPWPFARGEQIQPGAWAAGAAAVHDASWGTEVSDDVRFGRGAPRRHVNARVTLSGMPPDVTVQSIGVQGTLRFPDGTTTESSQSGGFSSSSMSTSVQAALGGAQVLNPAEVFNQERGWTPMMTLTEDEYLRYRGRQGRLDATVDFHLVRTREVGRLPLTPGVALDALDDGLSRLEVVAVQRRADAREITIRRWHATSPLSTERSSHQRLYALDNRSRGEALMGGEEHSWPIGGRAHAAFGLLRVPFAMMGMGANISGVSGGGGFSAGTTFLRFPGRGFGKAPRLDPSWFADAELVVLEVVPDGFVTKPLVVEEFVVPES